MNTQRFGLPSQPPTNIEPLLHRSWNNSAERPSNTLAPENILTYFCHPSNPFYDKTSNNQELIMQNAPMTNLHLLTGIQYNLVHHCGPLYVICKFRRASENSISPLCYYYIMDGTVYQCPDIYTLFQSRLTQAVNPLREALLQASKFTQFDVNKGYTWKFEIEPSKSSVTENEEKEAKTKKAIHQDPTKVRGTQYQWKRADRILHMTLQKFPPDMGYGPARQYERMDVDQSAPGSVATLSQQPSTPMPPQSTMGAVSTAPASQNLGPTTPTSVPMPVPMSNLALTQTLNSAPSSVPTKMGSSVDSPAMKRENSRKMI